MISLTSPSRPSKIVAAFVVMIATPLAITGLCHGKDHSTPQYDRGVNETLDTIMWVEDQAKHERRKLTWKELNERVCQEMRVRRTQPWERR